MPRITEDPGQMPQPGHICEYPGQCDLHDDYTYTKHDMSDNIIMQGTQKSVKIDPVPINIQHETWKKNYFVDHGADDITKHFRVQSPTREGNRVEQIAVYECEPEDNEATYQVSKYETRSHYDHQNKKKYRAVQEIVVSPQKSEGKVGDGIYRSPERISSPDFGARRDYSRQPYSMAKNAEHIYESSQRPKYKHG